MARFIECGVSDFEFHGHLFDNDPVNIDSVRVIMKRPWGDKHTGVEKPAIKFAFDQKHTFDWVYDRDADRDADWRRLLTMGAEERGEPDGQEVRR